MKYIDEYRDGDLARQIAQRIAAEAHPTQQYNFMEFCGGHTHAISRYGVSDLAGRLSGQGGVDAVQPAEVADWLANRGLYLGGRFPHEQCPFDPGPSGGRDPVVVHDEGVLEEEIGHGSLNEVLGAMGHEVSYAPGLPLTINNVDLHIDQGEFCVFVGPSGCGKSTLLRMLAGLEEITGGEILIDDKEIGRAHV